MIIRPVRDNLSHADGWTDRHDEAKSRFSIFRRGVSKALSLPGPGFSPVRVLNYGRPHYGLTWELHANKLV
jgi:hypothetical protein